MQPDKIIHKLKHMTMRRVRKYFLPRLARARAAEHPTIPPPAMTMSASSRGLELIMRELTMGDILGRGDTSARAHTALIIAVGGGLDAPGPGVLSDVHLGGGHSGGLPQQEAHVKSLESENRLDKLSSSGNCRHLEELLVLVGGGSGVTSLKSVHF